MFFLYLCLFLYLKNLSSPQVYNTFQTDIPLKAARILSQGSATVP